MDTRTSPIRMRLTQLREEMVRRGIDALLVPSSDPHLSEYLPERWQGRVWLSGFTGSMATLVVGSQRAALFADSRYWVQAEAELRAPASSWCASTPPASPAHLDWLVEQVPTRRQGRGRRPGAGPGRSAGAEAAARRGRHRAAHRARCAGRHLARPPRAARAAGVCTPGTACAAAARRQAGAGARGHGAAWRHPSLHLHRRRHRLADQPARQRRRIQPGVPGAPAARCHRRSLVRRRRQGRRALRA